MQVHVEMLSRVEPSVWTETAINQLVHVGRDVTMHREAGRKTSVVTRETAKDQNAADQ